MLSLGSRASGLPVRALAQCAGGRLLNPVPANPVMSEWEEKEHLYPGVVPYQFQDKIPLHIHAVPQPRPTTGPSLSRDLLTKGLSVRTGIQGMHSIVYMKLFNRFSTLSLINIVLHPTVGHTVRYLHNDIKIPDFDGYRKESTKNPHNITRETADERRLPLDTAKIGVGVTLVIAVKKVAQTLVANLSPAASTLALGVIEVDLSKIAEGKNITIKWNSE